MGTTRQTLPAHDSCTTPPLTLQSAKHLQEQRSYRECDMSSTSFGFIALPDGSVGSRSGFPLPCRFLSCARHPEGVSRAPSVHRFTEAANGECRAESQRQHNSTVEAAVVWHDEVHIRTEMRQTDVRQSVFTGISLG